MTKTVALARSRPAPAAAALLFVMAAAAIHPAKAQAPAAKPAPAASRAPAGAPDPARDLFETTCSNCHDLSVITGQRKSAPDWATTMDNMLAKGAPITDEQATQILAYLNKTYSDKN